MEKKTTELKNSSFKTKIPQKPKSKYLTFCTLKIPFNEIAMNPITESSASIRGTTSITGGIDISPLAAKESVEGRNIITMVTKYPLGTMALEGW